jgi:hypothetical protein
LPIATSLSVYAIAIIRNTPYGCPMNEELRINTMIAAHRNRLLRMALKITIYYLVLGAAVALAIAASPGFLDQLPLGGVGEIADFGSSSIYDLEEALLSADDEEIEDIVSENTRARLARGPAWLYEAMSLIYAMSSTLLLMLPVSWVYRAIHEGSVYDHSIDTTALVLPAVVAGIVTVVQHSLALAFSLAGIVAGVRHTIHSCVDWCRNCSRRQVNRNCRCADRLFQLCFNRCLRFRRRPRVTTRCAAKN